MPVISGFYAESSAVVQSKSCVDRAVSHGFDVTMSGGSCGKGTAGLSPCTVNVISHQKNTGLQRVVPLRDQSGETLRTI